MFTDDDIFNHMNPWEDEDSESEQELGDMEDCPDHLEHTAIMEDEI